MYSSNDFKNSALYRSAALLSKAERLRIYAILLIQVFLGLVDLFAIALVGILGSLAVTGVSSQDPSSRIAQVLRFLHIQDYAFQQQSAIANNSFSCIFEKNSLFLVPPISSNLIKFTSTTSGKTVTFHTRPNFPGNNLCPHKRSE